MARTPQTPATPDTTASSVVNNSALIPRNLNRQGLFVEQSPASTLGETAIGDSMPSTPARLDDSAILAHALRPLSLQESSEIGSQSKQDLAFASRSTVFPPGGDASTRGAPFESYQKATTYENADSLPNIDSQCKDSIAGDHNWQDHSVKVAVLSDDGDPFLTHNGVECSKKSSSITEEPNTPYQPRGDREIGEISGDNAQAIFSPNACVFVANLAAASTDDQLEFETARVFEQFGKVYVKIKRDQRGMPYAFCQYEKEDDAEKAISMGHGLLIAGRQCRTERAKVNRSLYLSRTAGGPISEEEARDILAKEGPIEKLWTSSNTDREMFRLPEGIWVTFAFYQDCRDAQASFKDDQQFRLEQPLVPDDVRQRVGRSRVSPLSRSTPLRGRIPPWLSSGPRHGSNSIFVGNLPMSISVSQLREVFEEFGSVRAVEIISKASSTAPSNSAFAFIEYTAEREVRSAMLREVNVDGRRLRVELRESHDHISVRPSGFLSGGSPRTRSSGGFMTPRTPNNTDVAMSRALALGVPMGALMQIFEPQSHAAVESGPSTPAISSVYSQMSYYGSPYSPQYGPYGSSTAPQDVNQANNGFYSQMNGISHPYQYSPLMNTHYGHGYTLSPYNYSSVSMDTMGGNNVSQTSGNSDSRL